MKDFYKSCKEYARLGPYQFIFILLLVVLVVAVIWFIVYGFILAPIPSIIIAGGAYLLYALGDFADWLQKRAKKESEHTTERTHYE